MNELSTAGAEFVYFPATIRLECDSPLDALIRAGVGQHAALNLIVAAWDKQETDCLLANIDGGRHVVVTRLPGERWVACHPWLMDPCASIQEAEKRMQKRRRHQTRGIVVKIARAVIDATVACG
ncbi:MAG TPA: hypothetical protein PLB97_04425 [Accumulibacter sp.]|jgi:hypothetical protein|nr:hypothetical protein [Accumulibacter sp.]HPP46873.1 hypothetical protein [Accumulibacter sp.]